MALEIIDMLHLGSWLPCLSLNATEYVVHDSGAASYLKRKIEMPGEDGWLHTVFPPLPSAILNTLSTDMGMGIAFAGAETKDADLDVVFTHQQIPKEFEDFLCVSNGARLFAGHLNILGVPLNNKDALRGNVQPVSANF